LNALDSGTADAPIVYGAYEGESVQLTGGHEIGGFEPVTDPNVLERLDPGARGHVLVCDLGEQGIDDYGELTRRGFRPVQTAALELFFNDKPMSLARWPNEGWLHIVGLPEGERVPQEHAHAPPLRAVDGFVFEGDRPQRWATLDEVWVHGYWAFDWNNSWERVASIDLEAGVLKTVPPHASGGYAPGQHFYFVNILEELDAPGEYYLDRKTGKLYFWPPAPLEGADLAVSALKTPLVTIKDASHVMLQGLVLELGRSSGVTVEGGDRITLNGCTLRNLGNHGIFIEGGTGHAIRCCEVYNTGDSGAQVNGGDRMTLVPAEHLVEDSHFHHIARWSRTYQPAVYVRGVGSCVAHNLIHDHPHTAIFFYGNDHLIEYNEIHHVCTETGDCGGMYTGADLTMRGNVIRYNYLHHVGGINEGSYAVYLDDFASGSTVFGNVFYQCQCATCIGGGHDNIFENNIFVDCEWAVHVDARGVGWAYRSFKDNATGVLLRLHEVNYSRPPYSERYPELVHILYENPAVPRGNRIRCNVRAGSGRWMRCYDGVERVLQVENNELHADRGIVDPEQEAFQRELRPSQMQSKGRHYRTTRDYPPGFVRIPFGEIGPRKDEDQFGQTLS
jgi:hypothetical protein